MENTEIQTDIEIQPPHHRFFSNEKMYEFDVEFSTEEMSSILKYWGEFNRPLVKTKVKQYMNDMQNGNWDVDAGNLVKFDSDGRLIEGRHRFTAALLLDIPFTTDVVWGLPRKAILSQDIGKVRNPYINPTLFKSESDGVIPSNKDFSKKRLQQSIARLMMANEMGKGWTSPSSMELEAKCLLDEEFISLASVPGMLRWMRKPGPRAAIALYAKRRKNESIEFRNQYFSDGSGFEKGSPVLALRNKIQIDSNGGNTTKEDMSYTIDAIHAFHENRKVTKLRQRTEWEF